MYFESNAKPEGNKIIKVTRVADLAAVPITLAEGKTHLRVTFTDDDTEITALILKAIRYVENYCNISIIYQRIEMIGALSCSTKLPYGPVIGIESVSDNANDSNNSGPVSYATSTQNWRTDGDDFYPVGCYRFRVVYTAGNFLPPDLKDVCLQVLTFLYENRGKSVDVEGLEQVLCNADNYRILSWI